MCVRMPAVWMPCVQEKNASARLGRGTQAPTSGGDDEARLAELKAKFSKKRRLSDGRSRSNVTDFLAQPTDAPDGRAKKRARKSADASDAGAGGGEGGAGSPRDAAKVAKKAKKAKKDKKSKKKKKAKESHADDGAGA